MPLQWHCWNQMTFFIPHIPLPFQNLPQCNLATVRRHLRQFITATGSNKRLYATFFMYAVVLPKTCKHTLMCKFGGVSLQTWTSAFERGLLDRESVYDVVWCVCWPQYLACLKTSRSQTDKLSFDVGLQEDSTGKRTPLAWFAFIRLFSLFHSLRLCLSLFVTPSVSPCLCLSLSLSLSLFFQHLR